MPNKTAQMTVQDLYRILCQHALDKSLKQLNLTAFHSKTRWGADLIFNDAYNDKLGRKAMQKLVDRINQFFDQQNGESENQN